MNLRLQLLDPKDPVTCRPAGPEVQATTIEDHIQFTATVPGKQYLIVVPGVDAPSSVEATTVVAAPGTEIYELQALSKSLEDDQCGMCRGDAVCVPVIPPPPSSLTATSWVWCPGK